MSKQSIYTLVNDLVKESKEQKDYHSGLMGEHLMVAGLKHFNIDKLRKLRNLINQILQEKQKYNSKKKKT